MPWFPWLRPALAEPASPRDGPPVLTVQPGQSTEHVDALGPPDSRGGVPSRRRRVCPQRPLLGLHGLRSAEVPKVRKGWPQGSSPEGGSRCGGAAPLICLAVQRVARGRQLQIPWQTGPGLSRWPGTLPFQAGESPQQAPRNLGLAGAFSDFSVCSCSV